MYKTYKICMTEHDLILHEPCIWLFAHLIFFFFVSVCSDSHWIALLFSCFMGWHHRDQHHWRSDTNVGFLSDNHPGILNCKVTKIDYQIRKLKIVNIVHGLMRSLPSPCSVRATVPVPPSVPSPLVVSVKSDLSWKSDWSSTASSSALTRFCNSGSFSGDHDSDCGIQVHLFML